MIRDDEKGTLDEGNPSTVVEEEAVVSLKHIDLHGERYAAIGELGRGGMGEVALVFDRRIGRRVALKRTRPGANVERFVREARVQGQLEHPTVVPLYDMIEERDGETTFTMKRVRGRTLKSVLSALSKGEREAEAQFTQRKLLSDFASVCLGVAFAHSRGVVHRDLKPDNLMLGDFGEVYVLDWGVAKIHNVPDLDDSVDVPRTGDATAMGSMVGTPGYMSPEQCMGKVDQVDERSDVYALGVILFELLALERFNAAKTIEGIVEATLAGVNARIHERTPSRNVAPELEEICVRATAKSPGDRFATARELHDAVERHLDHDRDVELRRTMALRHAKTAAETKDRITALSEAGRAIALDPTNRDAQAIVFRLLTEPPAETPPEAQRELDDRFAEERRDTARFALLTMPLFLSFAPLIVAMGVKSWPTFAVFYGAVFLFATGLVLTWRAKRPGPAAPFALATITMIANCACAMLYGPLVGTPALAILSTVSLVTQVDRHRWIIVLLGFAPILVPLGAVHEYVFAGDHIEILPAMVSFPPLWSPVLLVFMNVTGVLAGAIIAARLRDYAASANRKLVVQAWQLRQILPR